MINEDININKEGIYNPWNPEHIININTNGIYLFIGPKKLNNEKKYIRYNIPTNISIPIRMDLLFNVTIIVV